MQIKTVIAGAAVLATGVITACSSDDSGSTPVSPAPTSTTPTPTPTTTPTTTATTPPPTPPDTTALLQSKIQHIIVVYAENRGFDNIYGQFPGANGLSTSTVSAQKDRDAAGTVLPKLPQTWKGVTAAGFTPMITQADSDNIANGAFSLETQYTDFGFDTSTITRDLYHRFFENQMQINGGKNDQFAAWADSGGLVMGTYDGSKMAMWKVAQKYVLADGFFMGAFGGSFLNHQYLICGCAPEYKDADISPARPLITHVDLDGAGKATAHLTVNTATSPASALDGAPIFTASGPIAPKDYFGDGTFRAVNTMMPPYQPSAIPPAAGGSPLLADPLNASTLPPQTQLTVGDQLTAKSVTWKWYAGAWTSTSATAVGDRMFPSTTVPGSAPNFQFHHQPFNYFTAFDPTNAAAARAAHLADYDDLVKDITAGTLPAVSFYKPEGDLNQHAGYASVAAGDQHIADLIAKVEASADFANTVLIVTYDENGGFWDHVAPPAGDKLGPGTRIPAIIVSPYAKKGTVDHSVYDTGSILRLIARRFSLTTLPGIAARDAANKAAGGSGFGDLTGALDLTK